MRSRWRTKAAVPALVALAATLPVVASNVTNPRPAVQIGTAHPAARPDTTALVAARRRDDFAAMQKFRPGYRFWRYVFSLPDHSIAYGSAVDGRLLVTFPTKGDWPRDAVWTDSQMPGLLDDELLSRRLGERRDQVAAVLEHTVGPVQHNSTRGDALTPNAARYGRFLASGQLFTSGSACLPTSGSRRSFSSRG